MQVIESLRKKVALFKGHSAKWVFSKLITSKLVSSRNGSLWKFFVSKMSHFEKMTASKSLTSKMSEFEIDHFVKKVTSKDEFAECVTSKLVTLKLVTPINESLRKISHFANKPI